MRQAFLFLVISLAAARAEDLTRQVADILSANCLSCHGPTVKMSDLDLSTREGMLKGGKRGPALVPSDLAKSRLYRSAAHQEQPAMPPGKKLPDWQLVILSRWINTGAPMEKAITSDEENKKSLTKLEDRPITEEERSFWSFRPVKRVAPPKGGHPIDAFLSAMWDAKKLKPATEASKRVLVRRAYLDLWGLPPTMEQVNAFLADTRPDAFERLVDKLLDSPHYGERWARHWLDLVRYADSGGFEYDRDRADAFRYRDWVVRALSADMPYDQFVKWQIAGDEIAPGNKDALVATGFLRHGPEHNVKNEQTRMEELDDIVVTTANSFLAVTVGCARCHNHKFDPIPQKDYYRMQAVFFNTKANDTPIVAAEELKAFQDANKRVDEQIAPHKKALDALILPYREKKVAAERAKLPDYVQEALRTPAEKRTEGQKLMVTQVEKTRNFTEEDVIASMSAADSAKYRETQARIKGLEKERPKPIATAMAITDNGREPEPSYFLHRGSPDSKGSLMKPGVLSVITREEPAFPAPPADVQTTYRRKGFAEWLASKDNSLFTRVMVNRIWQHHFGEGIVRTPSNFGKTGDQPTHPELLDWLASEFVEQGWSMKKMHRLLMTSKAYRMAADDMAANMAADADNLYLWRMPRQRLEGEIIRDAVLAVAGTLDSKVGGPGVHPYIDPSLWQGSSGRTWPGKAGDDPDTWRRSIYVFSKRSIPLPMLDVFDKPDAITSCARRNRSTIAPQALILMNNAFVRNQAKLFADRLRREAGEDPAKQIALAFQLAYSRAPQASELKASKAFLDAGPEALVDFSQALFNSNEFVYMP